MKAFGPTTGYLWLDSWILANIVQLGTQQFCKKFLRRENDPTKGNKKGKNLAEHPAFREPVRKIEAGEIDEARTMQHLERARRRKV